MNKFSASKNQEVYSGSEEEIDIRGILVKYLHYWKWIIVSFLAFLLLGVFVYMCLDRKYDIKTSVLLKEDKGGASASKNSPLGGLQELGLLGTTNNIDNEIAVFSSPNLLRQVVADLELEVSYFEKGFFRNTEVYTRSPYYVRFDGLKSGELDGIIEVVLEAKGDALEIRGSHKYKKEKIEIKGSIDKLPGFFELPNELGKLYIAFRKDIAPNDKVYSVKIRDAQKIAYDLVDEIKISTTTKSSSVLNININTQNIDKGVDVLNRMTDTYNKNNVDENNEMARNTSSFIDARLDSISMELESIEDEVVSYQERQGITDLGSEAQLLLEKTSKVEEKRIEILTQMKILELVDDLIKGNHSDYKLVSTLGIADPGLVLIINEYNGLLMSYERLYRSTSENSPARIRAILEIENVRKSIQSSLTDVRTSLNISKNEADQQIAKITSRIHSVPAQQRGLLEITRQQEVKQALYIYLMQVREETNISLAATFAKAKIITDPIVPELPKSPRRNIILLVFLLLGLLVPIGIIFITEKLRVNICNREELERLTKVSVIGEIVKIDPVEDILVVKSNLTTPIVELFRSLRNNIKFILDSPDKKIVLVTSTIPGEGKTFVSVNLAASFALSDKRILLIGADIRNPKLADDMNLKRGAGLTSYLSGENNDWRSLLVTPKEFSNMDVLQAGFIPPNPNELFMKPALNKLLEEAKKDYDLIVIDSAPVGVISDTFIFAMLANVTIYVTRENATPKNAVSFINALYVDEKLPSMYAIINGVDPTRNRGAVGLYGYGKTYGYGIN